MGRITPSFRQLYEETVSELRTELQAALVDLNHKSAFDLLLKEAWNPELYMEIRKKYQDENGGGQRNRDKKEKEISG
jgi:hypothetical protein